MQWKTLYSYVNRENSGKRFIYLTQQWYSGSQVGYVSNNAGKSHGQINELLLISVFEQRSDDKKFVVNLLTPTVTIWVQL